MDYEYVQIVEEDNMYANFKRQLEVHNRKRLEEHGRSEFTTAEFEKILIYLEGGTRFEKAKAVSMTLPLQEEAYTSPVLFPFFDGLIPAGWLLDCLLYTSEIPKYSQTSSTVIGTWVSFFTSLCC